jgi:hypothetical protein
MISNAPEFLANFAAAITEADPAAAIVRRLVRDYLMPGWLAEIYRDSDLIKRLRKPVPKTGKNPRQEVRHGTW